MMARTWIGSGVLAAVLTGWAGTASAADTFEKVQAELVLAQRTGISPEVAADFVDRLHFLAAAQEDAEVRRDVLQQILLLCPFLDEESRVPAWTEVMDTVLQESVDDPRIGDLLLQPVADTGLLAAAEEYAELVYEETGSDEVKAVCLFARARLAQTRQQDLGQELSAEERAEACAGLREILDEYADLGHPWGSTYGEVVPGLLFALENLYVGNSVPDIRGQDLDGVEFALSDYTGKVVLLDFWADW